MSTCCLSNPEIGNLEVLHKIKQIGTTGSTTGTTANIYDCNSRNLKLHNEPKIIWLRLCYTS